MMKQVYRLFIFILLFAPLAFGTVEQWSLTIMETASLIALASFFYNKNRERKTSFYEIPGIVPLSLLLAYFALQLLPLPLGMINVLSPGMARLVGNAPWADQSVRWVSLSINQKATAMEFFRLASYTAFYVLTVQLLTRKELLKRTVAVIAIFSSLLSFFAIVQRLLSNNRIFWVRELTAGGPPFGPYVNPDHYAGLMEMLFPVVLCLFLFHKPGVVYGSLRERISGIFDHKMTNIHILLGFSSVLMATSIFLTLSRGGIVSLCISMVALGVILMRRDRRRTRGKIISLVFLLILLSVGWFGWTPVMEKFEKVREDADIAAMRPAMWRDTMKIIGDFPATGVGAGAFVHVYPKYRSISHPGILDHAHNDYIELFAEGGVIGALLFGWFLAEVIFKSSRAFMRRRESYSVYLYSGAAAGLLSILLHSFVDFNLHIGANGLYFFFLAGLMVSSANTRMRDGLGNTSLARRERPVLKKLSMVSFAVLVLSLIFNSGILLGELSFSSAGELSGRLQPTGEETERIRELSRRAALFDPLEAAYHYAAAGAEWRLSEKAAAVEDYGKALRLDPVNAEYTQMLGLLMSDLKEDGTADRLLRSGVDLDASSPWVYKRYASWLFAGGRKKEGTAVARRAIGLEPGNAGEYITLMVLYGLDDGAIRDSLPERAEAHRLFADYLSQTGHDTMADEEYKSALEFAGAERQVAPQFFYAIYRYYAGNGRHDDALMVMNRATEMLPRDAGLRVASGDAYEKAGISYRAAEEYRKALLIDPRNQAARKRLDALGQ